MPFVTLSSLLSTLLPTAIEVAGHVVDAANTKGASAKQSSKGKTHTNTDTLTNAFAACLAAALPGSVVQGTPNTDGKAAKGSASTTALTPALPKMSASTTNHPPMVAVSTTKTGMVSQPPTVAVPQVGAGMSNRSPTVAVPQVPANTANRSLTVAAQNATTTTPGLKNTATPHAATQAKLPDPHGKQATPPAPTPPEKPLSHDGQGEIHLGVHAAVEPAVPLGSEQITTNAPAVQLNVSGAAETPKMTEISRVSATSTAAVHDPAAPPSDDGRGASDALLNRLVAASGIGTGSVDNGKPTGGKAVDHASQATPSPVVSVNAAVRANHDDSRQQTPPSSSTVSGTNSAQNVPSVPVVADTTAAAPQSVAAPPAAPVADQLTRAFVAQADVVHQGGRTDFLLRLEPPQLGSVRIHLTAMDHTVSARIVAAQEGTRQLLEGQAQQLRQGLAQAGLSLGSFDVTRDGGGSQGRQPPPEVPVFLPAVAATPRTATVSSATQRPSSGIDLLA